MVALDHVPVFPLHQGPWRFSIRVAYVAEQLSWLEQRKHNPSVGALSLSSATITSIKIFTNKVSMMGYIAIPVAASV